MATCPSRSSASNDSDSACEEEFSRVCEDGDVVAWSRKAWALVKRLSNCDGFQDVDIETNSTQALDVSNAGGSIWRSFTETEALMRRQDLGPWYLGSKEVPVTENAVCSDPHRHCTKRIAEQLSGRPSKIQRKFNSSEPFDFSVPEESKISPEDVVVTVLLQNAKGSRDQEFDVLASQTLEDLRDAFYFVGDLMFDGPTRRASACIYIDGFFYVDRRQSSALDYSVELVDWLRNLDFALRDEKSRSMSTRICDLEIPFGQPCCFIRQGDIEHHMYFTGARLINGTRDCPFREGYPCLIWMRKYHRRRCVACLSSFASWVVLDSSRCPLNPAHLCHFCFRHFSEKRNGGYIVPTDYKAFPYLHDET